MVSNKINHKYSFIKGIKKALKASALAFLSIKAVLMSPDFGDFNPDTLVAIVVFGGDYIRNFLKTNIPKLFSWI